MSHTHTHTHIYIYIYIYKLVCLNSLLLLAVANRRLARARLCFKSLSITSILFFCTREKKVLQEGVGAVYIATSPHSLSAVANIRLARARLLLGSLSLRWQPRSVCVCMYTNKIYMYMCIYTYIYIGLFKLFPLFRQWRTEDSPVHGSFSGVSACAGSLVACVCVYL